GHLALIQRQLDLSALVVERPLPAVDAHVEGGVQPAALRQQRLERTKFRVGFDAGERRFMLLARQAFAALQGLHPPALALAHPQRNAGFLQRQVGGVEIDADQLTALLVALRRSRQDGAEVARRAEELQLDFAVFAHARSLRRLGFISRAATADIAPAQGNLRVGAAQFLTAAPYASPEPCMNAPVQPIRDLAQPRHDWTLEEIEALFELPFTELVFRAAEVHRRWFDPTELQISQLLSV